VREHTVEDDGVEPLVLERQPPSVTLTELVLVDPGRKLTTVRVRQGLGVVPSLQLRFFANAMTVGRPAVLGVQRVR